MDFSKVTQAFENYLENYDQTQEMIALKKEHSYAVAKLMKELAYRLNLSKEQLVLAQIIGLLHDIGRFEQFKVYGKLSDKNSDHADESCVYLFEKGHIRDYVEEDQYDRVIESAIRYHNKLTVPELSEMEALFTNMIRDMDKIDIYKQYAVHFHYVFDAEQITPEVLETFKNHQLINLHDKKTKTDAVLIVLAFLFDFNFDESYDILVETDNFDLFLSTIEVPENSEKLWRKVREICFDVINQGVGHEIQRKTKEEESSD